MRRTALTTTAFAVVLAVATAGPAAAAAASPADTAPPRIVDLKPRVVELKPRIVDLKPKRHKHTFTVDSDVLFAFDSARLSPEAAKVLAGVVRDLRAAHPKRIGIVGFTDSVGTPTYNKVLSQRRALTVLRYLRTHVGTAGVRYAAAGLGESHPVAANTGRDGSDNPDGRRRNRRVVIAYQS